MNTVRCTFDMKQHIAEIDLSVFDIDGVLIDTSSSFIATIVTTTRYSFRTASQWGGIGHII